MLDQLNTRAHQVLKLIVESFMCDGAPVGSRALAQSLHNRVSTATIRNVMAELEKAGLLYAPHVSAGRLPTDAGLHLYLDGLLELNPLSEVDRKAIDQSAANRGLDNELLLQQFSNVVSGLSQQVGLVVAPKLISRIKHIEFILVEPGQVLAVMVAENGLVENRLLRTSKQIGHSQLNQATNYLNAKMIGKDLQSSVAIVREEIAQNRAQLDSLCEQIVSSGVATWSSTARGADGTLLISGQANLLENVHGLQELENISKLFQSLEAKEHMLEMLQETHKAEGVQIFIGTQSSLFDQGGFSMITASYSDAQHNIVGAVGVIGPRRMNYARIIPVVDYTANVVTRMLAST